MIELPVRIQEKISPEPNSGCWLWTGAFSSGDYGYLKVAGTRKNVPAHKAVYEFYKGKVRSGYVLDHICRQHCCVNPDHLEPVTHRVNILRGTGASARNAVKTHCPFGHSLTDAYIVRGARKCRVCQLSRMAAQYKKNKFKVYS